MLAKSKLFQLIKYLKPGEGPVRVGCFYWKPSHAPLSFECF